MERALRSRETGGAYRGCDGAALAESLTAHLRAVSHDTHLEVRYSPEPLAAMDEALREPTEEDREQRRRDLAWMNYGFVEVKRLPGNVGFLDLDAFVDPALGGPTAAAAMQFLAACDALIIDLRFNTGGHARMATLLASYLFDGEPVHLMDIYSRPEDFTLQTWTAPYVPGPRFASGDVYLLTSERTHSAAEHFAYALQTTGRATVVGAVTRGGAHPTGRYRISEHFGIAVPEARAISPITGTNWEGTGVRPDVPVPADRALETAQRLALECLWRRNRDPERAEDLRRALARLEEHH